MAQLPETISKSFALDSLQKGNLKVYSPIDGAQIGAVNTDAGDTVVRKIELAHRAYLGWRSVPAPQRGELIRIFGNVLRDHKQELGRLVTIECGKSFAEGKGEVQEMIDICDYAVGLSRQLYGLTIASERPGHRMMETWHPIGVIGVISAFNFPVAVWCWNFALAIVCGNSVVWKPSEKTPLTALACQNLWQKACAEFAEQFDGNLDDLSHIVIGERGVGEILVDHEKVRVISATGSTRMGGEVGPQAAKRFARTILELGGNNAMIVTPSADLNMAVRAILFSAVGTAGQRCTTLRRLIVHESVQDKLVTQLIKAYKTIRIGDPLDDENLMGPLIDKASFEAMQKALKQAAKEGGAVEGGERVLAREYPNAYYVTPAIVTMPGQTKVVKHETFAPIMYVMRYRTFDEALEMHNDVPQGLSSCIFTTDLREAEAFLSASGSDCGIANVNIGPSGAEIGGAFGGEKETGGGRESGSDAWKGYMRRQTNTINYSTELPLAQGIKFG